jgi:hypothetical protein
LNGVLFVGKEYLALGRFCHDLVGEEIFFSQRAKIY